MRNELLDFESTFWGITKDDLRYSAELSKSLFKTYMLSVDKEKIVKDSPDNLYLSTHYREAQFALHFGIWRLQAVFETLLKRKFNISIKSGLTSITRELKKRKLNIIDEDELKQWATLRNCFSHSAPEQFNPAPRNLIEKDIDDYCDLLVNIFDNLLSQTN